MRVRIPFVLIKISIRTGSRSREVQPPRLTLRAMMVLIVILAGFLGWVVHWEEHRVRRYQASTVRYAESARTVGSPRLAAQFLIFSRASAARSRPWSAGWSELLMFDMISYGAFCLALWMSYRVVFAIWSVFFGLRR